MRFASSIFAFLLKFGGVGLLVVGILDSSYLVAPWGNDLLLVAMTSRHPRLPYMLYLAAMSAVGSVLGSLLIDLTMRPVGAKGLEKYLSARRVKYVRDKVQRDAGLALTVASLTPPPFPFTAFVMAAAALQYSRARLVAIVAAMRLFRFILLGLLALRFGASFLKWAHNPLVQGLLVGLIVLCIVASVISVYGWIAHSHVRRR